MALRPVVDKKGKHADTSYSGRTIESGPLRAHAAGNDSTNSRSCISAGRISAERYISVSVRAREGEHRNHHKKLSVPNARLVEHIRRELNRGSIFVIIRRLRAFTMYLCM